MIYLDSCAIVKLIRDEPESEALQAWLDERADEPVVTSEVAEADVLRVVRRNNCTDQGVVVDPERLAAELAEAAEVLDVTDRVVVDRDILRGAGALETPFIRTLDAIHLVSALGMQDGDLQLVTYDRRFSSVAREARLTVIAPS